MFPIADDNPVQRSPIVTWALIVACVLVFLWQLSLGRLGDQMIFALGVIPASLFGYAQLPADIALIPPWATIFTSMFLHGGWLHLIGNMLSLRRIRKFLWLAPAGPSPASLARI
jgi:membrane associated rhomboid family serine protease